MAVLLCKICIYASIKYYFPQRVILDTREYGNIVVPIFASKIAEYFKLCSSGCALTMFPLNQWLVKITLIVAGK